MPQEGQADRAEREQDPPGEDAEGAAAAPEAGAAEQGQRPFDENPPVDPSEPQVGNSKATFFMPRESEEEADESEGDEEEG